MASRSATLLVVLVAFAGCGVNSSASGDGGLPDASFEASGGPGGSDAGPEAGGNDATGDTIANDAGGDATNPNGVLADAGVDSGPASDTGAFIVLSDDGPGDVDANVTVIFDCGPSLQCDAQMQYCFVDTQDAGPKYSCVGIAAQCEPTPSCACLMATSAGACPCSVQGVGLQVTCM